MAKSHVTFYPYKTTTSITLQKVELIAYKHIRIKRDNDGTVEQLEYDLRNLSVGSAYASSENDSAVSYANHATGDPDECFFTLANWYQGDEGRSPLSFDVDTYPATVWQAQGESDTALAGPFTAATDVPTAPTVLEQRLRVVDAILKVWRPQKQAWLLESLPYADSNIHKNITQLVGAWLRAADRAIQIRFWDSTLAQDTLERFVLEMAKGASDVTSVQEFVQSINTYTTLYPDGPTDPVAWVSIDTSTTPDTVTRNRLATNTNFLTSEELPTTYDATATDWIVANTEGQITLSQSLIVPTQPATATLVDADGISALTWTWQRQLDGQTQWNAISSPTVSNSGHESVYTGVAADSGNKVRVIANYTDRFGAKSVTSDEMTGIASQRAGSATLSVGATGPGERTLEVSVTDPDGDVTISEAVYFWKTNAGDTWSQIAVVESGDFKHTIDASELPKFIRADVRYTDPTGIMQSATAESQVLVTTGNAPGTLTFHEEETPQGTNLVVSVTDPNTVTSIQSFIWQYLNTNTNSWNLAGNSRRVLNVTASTRYRCIVSYTDWIGTGQHLAGQFETSS